MTLRNRFSLILTILMLALLALNTQAATSQSAGVVLLVSGQANAQRAGEQVRTLNRRADIFVGDQINTSTDSQLQLRMKDGAMIALGANAEFIVKAYSDDAAGDKKDEAVLSLVKGGLRTISGQIDKSAYTMETPTATLGIRGTAFDVYVKKDGTTVVILREGIVDVTSKNGQVQRLSAKGLASIIEPGKAPGSPEKPPQEVLDYLRGILPDLPDDATWEAGDDGGVTVKAGEDIINIINDYPPGIQGDGDVPGVPVGGAPAGCSPNDFKCLCRNNPRGC